MRGRSDAVVGIGHESRVNPADEAFAGSRKGGLSHGVVLGEECEHDDVANGCINRIGSVDKPSSPSYGHLSYISIAAPTNVMQLYLMCCSSHCCTCSSC